MASWDDLMSFVRLRYEIMRQQEDGELWFNLPTTGGRTQLVAVRQSTGADGHPWVEITSPVGKAGDLDLVRLLASAGQAEAGGVISVDGVVLFRHSIPLDDTAVDGFDRPFQLVVTAADRLEHELTGADEH
ncbi:MAG TPA: hypothetical protein VNA11_09310 [Pseudonocardia sp.]|jgi:hypothetical protein|nr:hypothetical protein [Pseudonocardia sp.]